MKLRRVLSVALISLLWTIGAKANDNTFVVNSVEIPQGGSAKMEVGLNIPSYENDCCGFQFMLFLPTGVTASNLEVTDRVPSGWTPNMSSKGDYYQILVYNSDETRIGGTNGTIARITLTAGEGWSQGDNVTASLKTCKITTSRGSSELLNDELDFDITIGEPDDGRIKFNEASTSLPNYTAGSKADVTMTRTIKKDSWSTIVFPFNLTKANATAIFGSDVQFAKFSGFEVDYGDDEENITPLGITVKFESYTIPVRGNLSGGTPVLIKTSKDITEIKLDQVTLTDGVTDVSVKDEYETPGKFTATLVKTVVPEDGLFITGNKFWYSTGETNIKAFRGWFELGAVLDKDTDFGAKIGFFIDEMPTSVDGIAVNGNQQLKGAVYTVGGQLVGKDVRMNQLKKGVYIKDGRKFVIK